MKFIKKNKVVFKTWVPLLMSLTSCTMIGPDYQKPKVKTAEEWLNSGSKRVETTFQEDWWKQFADPTLNLLINEARKNNLSVRTAGLRILEARAQLGIANGNIWAQTQQFNTQASVNDSSSNAANSSNAKDNSYHSLGSGFDLAWEIDLWGKFRRSINSSEAILDAMTADLDDIMITLTADVAQNYVLMRTLQQRLKWARENVQWQEESLKIASAKFNGGTTTELDVMQAETLLYETRSNIPSFIAEIRNVKNRLAILLGKRPGEADLIFAKAGPIPTLPAKITVGMPNELLRRRPDVRRAERQLGAQSEKIGIAKTELFPHFSLTGSVGLLSSNSEITANNGSQLSDIFSADSITSSFGPSIRWNIWQYGRLKNKIRVEDARFEQLSSIYESVVLKAQLEVENAMSLFINEEERHKNLELSAISAQHAAELAALQYKEGTVDFQRVIDSLSRLVHQNDRVTDSEGAIVLDLINIYRALGGGWQQRPRVELPVSIIKRMKKRTDWDDYLQITED